MIPIPGQTIVRDRRVRHPEHGSAGEVGLQTVPTDRIALHLQLRGVNDDEAVEVVTIEEQMTDTVLVTADNVDADAEVSDRPALDGQAAVAAVENSAVTKCTRRTALHQCTVTVDSVTIQVKSDVVSADDDPIARTVDEIVVKSRVPGDRRAALNAHWPSARLGRSVHKSVGQDKQDECQNSLDHTDHHFERRCPQHPPR